NQVSVLSDIAELPDQIDVEAARQAASDAQGRLGRDSDDEAAADDLRWAQVRLEVSGSGAGSFSS
ncbi:hypothetical protein, partial [Enterococcus faecium]|uniref:hypothetical protein n=1 Tax=Enterococcus faecium TaxID=1352 RepID=UPI003F427B12